MTTHQLNPYEQLRLEKIKRNEARLASLGLLAPKWSVQTKKAKSVVSKSSSPTRSSRRLKHEPAQYEALSKAQRKGPTKCISSPLTDEEKALISKEMEGDFLGKFEVSAPSTVRGRDVDVTSDAVPMASMIYHRVHPNRVSTSLLNFHDNI